MSRSPAELAVEVQDLARAVARLTLRVAALEDRLSASEVALDSHSSPRASSSGFQLVEEPSHTAETVEQAGDSRTGFSEVFDPLPAPRAPGGEKLSLIA